MKRYGSLRAVAVVLVLFLVAPALADWDLGDPYKMHYPQMPKTDGWDVRAGYYTFLADDFLCTETGPITDIHFWASWKSDIEQWADVGQIHTAIWTDDRSGPFSKPGVRVWHNDWNFSEAVIRQWGMGPQGWYDPSLGLLNPMDHDQIWQINLVNPQQVAPFIQEQGTIYWLEISFVNIIPTADFSTIGWKQSGSPHFEDDAVWRTSELPWAELRDPLTQESMDLAFVITPEPASLGLLALGLLAIRRR